MKSSTVAIHPNHQSTFDKTVHSDPDATESFVNTAFLFEVGLGIVALLVGWLVGIDPLATVVITNETALGALIAVLQGIAATLPLLAALYVMNRVPLGSIEGIRQFVSTHIVPLFKPLTLFELGAISVAAGFGEEALFRGLLQAGIAESVDGTYGIVLGVVVASIVFGLCHWITPAYAVLATIAGAYFGLLFLLTGNLLAPLVAHALYDFIALVLLTRGRSTAPSTDGEE